MEFAEESEEGIDGGKEGGAVVDGAIEVKSEVADGLQFGSDVGF